MIKIIKFNILLFCSYNKINQNIFIIPKSFASTLIFLAPQDGHRISQTGLQQFPRGCPTQAKL